MKDFISKMTFGFLMAHLFPGATVVIAVAFMEMCRLEAAGHAA